MRAEGKGAWWNQYSNRSVPDSIARAIDSDIQFVIVKADYPAVVDQFLAAGVRVGVENYTKPDNPEGEGEDLARAVNRGGDFAVINAEVEWETAPAGKMRRLIGAFRNRQPNTELYASVDTRGERTRLTYQQILGEYVSGWMPMIYPLAFRPNRPSGYIGTAFADCLDRGQDFQGKPVLPTIQTYDHIGVPDIKRMLLEVERRGLQGYQAYTIGHATDTEWEEIASDSTLRPQEEDKSWLDSKVIGFDGQPVIFEVLHGSNLEVREVPLTRKEYITFSALKLIIGTHSHDIKVTMR